MTLIVPRISGISPELSAFYDNIARENARLTKLLGQLDDTIADTRVSLGLTDTRLTDVSDKVDENGNAIAGVGDTIVTATQGINDRVTEIETKYSQFGWDQVKRNIAAINVPGGAYNALMPGYTLTAQKSGWYEVNMLITASASNSGALGLVVEAPSNIGFHTNVTTVINDIFGSPTIIVPVSGIITQESNIVANNAAIARLFSFRYFLKLDKDDAFNCRLVKVGALTLTVNITASNILSMRHMGDEI